MYKLADEPPMKYSMLATMDGNNSLKLVDSTFQSGSSRLDDRISTSSRWITPEDVDRFKEEVANSHQKVKYLLLFFTSYLYNLSHSCQLKTLLSIPLNHRRLQLFKVHQSRQLI